MTTSDLSGGDGCNIVYSEDATAPGCATNDNGQSNSAQHHGYNVYVRDHISGALYPYDLNPFVSTPYIPFMTPTGDDSSGINIDQYIQKVTNMSE